MPKANTVDNFWKKVEKTDTCWIWKTGTNSKGYGIFPLKGKKYFSHRFSYELHKGKIPDGLQVMHGCDIRRCVNPDHLSVGTNSDNQMDRVKKGRHNHAHKTHCKNGHEFNLENSTFKESKTGNIWRKCKICQSERLKKL